MTIGEIIRKYREDNDISLREFSRISGISNSYLSMLESGRHPRSGRPIVPTLTKLNQIAAAMHVGVDDLISVMDDMPVSFDEGKKRSLHLSDLEKEIVLKYRSLSLAEKKLILRSLGLDDEI